MTVSSDRPMNPQSQSLLFAKLPTELRSRIFELVLYVDDPEDSGIMVSKVEPDQERCSVLRLLETCRLVHSEAEEIFYATNRFCFFSDFSDFLDSLTPRRVAALKHFRLNGLDPERMFVTLLTCLQTLPQTASLHCVDHISEADFGDIVRWAHPDPLVHVLRSFARLTELRFVLRGFDEDYGDVWELLKKTMRRGLLQICAQVTEGKATEAGPWSGKAELVVDGDPVEHDAPWKPKNAVRLEIADQGEDDAVAAQRDGGDEEDAARSNDEDTSLMSDP